MCVCVCTITLVLCVQIVAHSVGTWNAFEFLMLARMEGLPMPAAAFLSAFPAPDIPMEQRPWRQQSSLSEEEFKVTPSASVTIHQALLCTHRITQSPYTHSPDSAAASAVCRTDYFLINVLNANGVQDECRAWDINNIIFEPSMWTMYQPMLRADFSLFDSYEFTHQV